MTDRTEHVILSNYPLSGGFRARLEQCAQSELRFVNIAELRRTSLLQLLKALHRIRAAVVSVALEDDSATSALPILQIGAALTAGTRLQCIDSKLTVTPFGRAEAARHAIALLAESGLAAIDYQRSCNELRRLMVELRFVPDPVSRLSVAYLNCNLWFGLKAGGSVGHVSGVANSFMDHGIRLSLHMLGDRLLVDERALLVPLPPPRILAMPFEKTHYRFNRHCIDAIGRSLTQAPVGFIYQRLSLGNYSGVVLSRRFRIPLVIEYNGSEAWIAKNWGRPLRHHDTAVLAEKVALHHAHLIVTVSEALRDELLDRGVEPERIVVYPNCIDPKTYDGTRFSDDANHQLRAELGLDSQHVIATFVGTFGQWHGVDVLAQSIRSMVLEHRTTLDALRLRFLLIGDGQKMPLVRSALEGIGAEPYVRLTGLVPQREAPRFLAASDLLLSPHVANADGSRFFGSPTKLFEYMAMGRGIVASDLDQLGDVLQPAIKLGRDGSVSDGLKQNAVALLVTPGDTQCLIRGIELLARDEQLRNNLGRNARRLALSRYTWHHHVAAILDGMRRVGLFVEEPASSAAMGS